MKKYFIGLVAVILAVGFSAFTAPHKVKSSAKDPQYIWYEVVNNQVDPDAPLNETAMSKADFEDDPLTSCPTGNTVDCVRGFLTNNLPQSPSQTADEHIQKSN